MEVVLDAVQVVRAGHDVARDLADNVPLHLASLRHRTELGHVLEACIRELANG